MRCKVDISPVKRTGTEILFGEVIVEPCIDLIDIKTDASEHICLIAPEFMIQLVGGDKIGLIDMKKQVPVVWEEEG